MTPKQAKVFSQFLNQFIELVNQNLNAFVDASEKSNQFSIANLSAHSMPLRKEILSKTELANRLGVCVRTINELQTDGLPSINVKRRVVFDFEDVLDWLKDQTVKSRRKKNLRMIG